MYYDFFQMIHIFNWLACVLCWIACLKKLFRVSIFYIIRSIILEKQGKTAMSVWLLILVGSPALNSGTTLAVFSLLGKIWLFKSISNKYLSSMFSPLKQFLITLKLIPSYTELLLILVKKFLFSLVNWNRVCWRGCVYFFKDNYQIALMCLVFFWTTLDQYIWKKY